METRWGLTRYRWILLKNVEGDVLETNGGSNNNLRFYDFTKVNKVTVVDYQLKAMQQALKK